MTDLRGVYWKAPAGTFLTVFGKVIVLSFGLPAICDIFLSNSVFGTKIMTREDEQYLLALYATRFIGSIYRLFTELLLVIFTRSSSAHIY